MGIELYFSNSLEQLAEKMSDIICYETYNKKNIFKAPAVIVPNQNIAKWLQLFIAKKHLICMNIDMQHLESGLWNMLSFLDESCEKPDFFDMDHLKTLLFFIFHNLDFQDPDLKPIARYLSNNNGDKKSVDYAAKLWQLTVKLAVLFQEYESHRFEMINQWTKKNSFENEMERCQKAIYLKIKKLKDKYTSQTGICLHSMSEYAQKVFAGLLSAPNLKTEKKLIYSFGLSQISEFHLNIIGRLMPYYDIYIYAFNPSREFWEDIKTPWEKRWIEKKNANKLKISPEEKKQGELFYEQDNSVLAMWGKPGRESIRLLCELTDYNFNAFYVVKDNPENVLESIKNSIYTLSENKKHIFNQDRSLQIIACPSIFREVETVYNNILYNLEKNDKLLQTDIAVMVPDMTAYKPVFDSIFKRSEKRILYNIVDFNAQIESVYGQAVLAILDLVSGRFSRKEVFELMMNPCFMSKWEIGSEQIRIWAKWADSLNVFHTFCINEKKKNGYFESANYTWKQGLQRLRLSRIMAPPDISEVDIRFNHFQGLVPYNDINTDDTGLVEKFCLAVETLHDCVVKLKKNISCVKKWKVIFFQVCDRLIKIPENQKGEASVLRMLTKSFDKLIFYDQIGEDATCSSLDVEIIKEYIRLNLKSISGGTGDYLTQGITISALQPMRPIPFKIVYVLGMEEGIFPGKSDTSSLDLRLLKRRIGDVSIFQRNCYLFLELLLSVKEKFYITYVSRDLQKDRMLVPCSVVNQLSRYIEKQIFEKGQKFKVAQIPLKGSSRHYLDFDENNSWTDAFFNYCKADRIIYYRTSSLWDVFTQYASQNDLNKAEKFSPCFSLASDKSKIDKQPALKLDSNKLKKFLENPVKQSINIYAGLYDGEKTIEDLSLNEDEPFFSEFPVDYNLVMRSVKRWLDLSYPICDTQKFSPEEIFDLVYDDFSRKSKTPEGVYAESDREKLKSQVLLTVENISCVLSKMQSAKKIYKTVLIGDHNAEMILSKNHPEIIEFDPLQLHVETKNRNSDFMTCVVELKSQLSWLWKDWDDTLNVLVLTGSAKPHRKMPDKYIFEPLLFYLICLAGDKSSRWISNNDIVFHVIYKKEISVWRYNFSKEVAIRYLTIILFDYLDQTLPKWLPFEKVSEIKVSGKLTLPYTKLKDRVDATYKKKYAVNLHKALQETDDEMLRLIKPEIYPDAYDKVRERFEIFFQTI